MKFDKIIDVNLLTGVLFGVIIGLHYPLEAYKTLLVVVFAVLVGSKILTHK